MNKTWTAAMVAALLPLTLSIRAAGTDQLYTDNTMAVPVTEKTVIPVDLDKASTAQDVVLLGASPDTVKSHRKFADKESLNFPLLADPEKEIVNRYQVWVEKSMYGRKYMGVERTTFIIDKRGKIKHIFPKVKVNGHVQEVLDALAN